MDRLIDSSLKEYLVGVGEKIPAPGGGSVTAAVLCCGVSLYKKCLLYSFNNFEKEDLKNIELFLNQATEKTLALIDRDREVYLRLNDLIKDKSANRDEMQKAYCEAASVPLDMIRVAVAALDLINRSASKIKKTFVSDLIAAVSFLEAAFNSALIFVEINLKSIDMSLKEFSGFDEKEIARAREDFKRIRMEIENE
ncbi:MAG: cyclodeaminase/cyclohydrolase family protein [Candidatus Kaelpia aquatica]|nr:cyclodeaminase/cyclohydrolase family protein [Candidatus Kaelpia aquatica]